MKLKNMTKQELETLSYTDLTDMILKEEKKAINTPTLFHKICDLLGFSDSEYETKIGDYYTSLTTDKRFTLLENGKWDLKDRHAVKIVVDDDEEVEEDYEEELEEELETEEEIDPMLDENDDDLTDDDDDDMEDLSIIEEEDDE